MEMLNDELYDRQTSLNLNPPESAIVVGCGGVGAWVALDLALSGVSNITLIDPDKVEKTNLNRTPFKIKHIGEYKVNGLADLIFEKRELKIMMYNKKIEELDGLILSNLEGVLIDCRDTVEPLPEAIQQKCIITGGYDGFDITMHVKPNLKNVWGETQMVYTTTPSFLIPPQLIASLITLYLCCPDLNFKGEKIKTFSVLDMFKKIME